MKRFMRLASKDTDTRRASFRSKKGDKLLKKDGFTLLYLGHSVLTDAKASDEVPVAIRTVKQSPTDQKIVQIVSQGIQLYVKEKEQELLTSPLTNISQCIQHTEEGFSDCFGLVFNSGPWIKQCHIFQAKSDKEASDIVSSIHKSVKSAIKSLRRKTEIPSSLLPSPLLGQERLTQRRKSDVGIRSLTSDSLLTISVPSVQITAPEPYSSYTPAMNLKPSPWKRKKDYKDLGRSEKIEIIVQVSKQVKESNNTLRQSCNNPHPQSPFERALHAINLSSVTLLSYLLDKHMLNTDACDHDGNTLIHYAVAMQKVDIIQVLYERISSLEQPSNHKLRPLHRAVVDGNKHVIIALLERGANPNSQDEEKNTPLHYAASQKEQHESCWVLLQYGAMIMKQNLKGIRPIDLLPDLKEMQNRLVGSMCKSFTDPKEKMATPLIASPSPSSSLNVDSQYEGNGLDELLNKAKEQVKSIKSKLRSKHKKKVSRSISNLSELLEAEEDEMNRQDRLQKLQYPLLKEYPQEYFEIDMHKNEVEKRLNELIRQGKSSKSALKRSTSDPEISSIMGDKASMLNKPSEVEESGLSDTFQKLMQQFEQNIPPPRPFPQTPMSTLHDKSLQDTLNAAFDTLEMELVHSVRTLPTTPPPKKEEEIVKISPRAVRSNAETVSPPQKLKSKDETIALLDDYISQIKSAADELEDMKYSRTKSEPKKVKEQVLVESSESKLKTPSKPLYPESPIFSPKRRKNETTIESSSSSETRRRYSYQELQKRGHHRVGSTGSNISAVSMASSSSLSSLHQYNSHHSSLLAFPIEADSGEPGAQSLRILVLLSRNPECIQPLISHICLSEFKDRLLASATSQESSLPLITTIATLVQNIFDVGGADGRKTAVESGMLDIVLKLLASREPIPGTCLMILNSLLVSDDDNDYLRTIAKIPCEPLLGFLEHTESDNDSGLGSQRDPSLSSTTTSDNQHTDEAKAHNLFLPSLTKDRALSLTTSESSSAHTGATPTLQGHIVTQLEARRIVLKMLAISSTHTKVQLALNNPRCISLLMEYVSDVSQENKTNAAITLANIGQNIESHNCLQQMGIIEKVKSLLTNGPRPRYQALRILVYLGKLQLHGLNLFDHSTQGGYEADPVIKAVDGQGHTYVRGVTVETAVKLLTSNVRELWGGIILREVVGHHLPKERVVDFFLTTYRSFLHPLIFMRLLLHRLDCPGFDPNPFNWSMDSYDMRYSQIHTIPAVHQSVLNILGQWIETYPEDFHNNPQLQDYLEDVTHRLRKFRGVYTPHAHRLRSLSHDLQRPNRQRIDSTSVAMPQDYVRVPHHENLYIQCKQLVSEDLLPVTMDTAVHLAGLQLHIETLADNTLNFAFMEGQKGKKESRIYLNHLKHALPAWCFRVKNISKKVREKLIEFEGLSDRNAKHMYIEKCQTAPGYQCTFYNIKVPMGGKFRRGNISQLMGISDHEIVFLEEKTRELVATYQLQDIKNVHHIPSDVCTIVIQLISDHTLLFHVEKDSIARQIEMVLDNLGQKVLQDIEKEDIDDWMTNWGQSPSSLHMSGDVQETTSQSSLSSPHGGERIVKELEETITPITREEETQDMNTPTTVKANGTPTALLTPHSENLLKRENSFSYPEIKPSEQPSFCNCPPDPEIPLHIDVHLLSLQEILLHPLEVARQVTLIDHERLCCISKEELMQRAGIYPRNLLNPTPSTHSIVSQSTTSAQSACEGGIERLAHRFNQLGNWIVHSVLQYTQEEDRGWVIQQFITTARYCLEYRNYSSTMAIVVGGLCSPPIRRLKRTWEHVNKLFRDELESMADLLSSKNNYKHYREVLERVPTPAVPYFGIFTRDLTFILDGNPDYLRNVVNLHKRRQVYAKLEEIKKFQTNRYNFEPVLALQEVLTNHVPMHEDDLHALSHSLEPSHQFISNESRIRSGSVSSLTNLGFLKHSFSKNSGSSSNLLSV